jgi:hypothetical protein
VARRIRLVAGMQGLGGEAEFAGRSVVVRHIFTAYPGKGQAIGAFAEGVRFESCVGSQIKSLFSDFPFLFLRLAGSNVY